MGASLKKHLSKSCLLSVAPRTSVFQTFNVIRNREIQIFTVLNEPAHCVQGIRVGVHVAAWELYAFVLAIPTAHCFNVGF